MNDEPAVRDQPRQPRALGYGLLAALAVGLAYGVAAELFGLTWGLIVVGLFGGMVIGAAITLGAWDGADHPTIRQLRLVALALAVGSWLIGLVVAYVVSQALIPDASTALLERLSLDGFRVYFSGVFDAVGLIHFLSLALMAVMAWRGAR